MAVIFILHFLVQSWHLHFGLVKLVSQSHPPANPSIPSVLVVRGRWRDREVGR